MEVFYLLVYPLVGTFGLLSSVWGIIVFLSAFQDGLLAGILCLLFPFYVFYYGGWLFQHEKRALILAGWLGPILLYIGAMVLAMMMAMDPVV